MTARDISTSAISVVLVAALVMCVPLALDAEDEGFSEAAALPSVLRLGFMQQLDSLNPYVGLNDVSYVFYGLVYDTLTCLGNDLEIVPNLATSWWAVPGGADSDPKLIGMPYGSVWQYNLSRNTSWTDGEPFTADDVVYNIWLNAEPSHYDSMWAYQPYSYYIREAWKIDEYTVRISFWDRVTLEPMPAAYAPSISIPMLPKHLLEQLPGGFPFIGMNWTGLYTDSMSPGMPIVGTGPFMATSTIFSDWIAGDHITLVRNPNCHWSADYDKSIRFDKIEMRFFQDSTSMVLALKSGDIDAAAYPPTAYDAIREDVESGYLNNVTCFNGPKITQYWTDIGFCMNEGGPNPSRLDPLIRQALHMATNKPYIVSNMYLGYASVGSTLVPPVNSYWHYEPAADELFDYDLTAAANLLEANGYIDIDGDGFRECTAGSTAVQMGWVDEGKRLAYEMLVRKEYPEEKDIAQYLKTQWEQIGVLLQYLVVEELTLSTVVYSYMYDSVIWYWTGDIDPNYILFTQSKAAWSGWSDNKYCNPAFEENYSLSVRELDATQRKAYVDNCQRIHYLDSPYIILANTDQMYAWRTDTFSGWGDWAADPGRSLDNYWTGNPLFFDLVPFGGSTNSAPTIGYLSVYPNPVLRHADTTFEITARDSDFDTLKFTIDFGDGRDAVAYGDNTSYQQIATFTHSYKSDGVYDVTVWVDDGVPDAGHIVTKVFPDRVMVGPPESLQASITPESIVVYARESKTLSAQLSWDGVNLAGPEMNYFWTVSNSTLGSFDSRIRSTVKFIAGAGTGTGSISCTMSYYGVQKTAVANLTIMPPQFGQVVVSPPIATMLCDSTRMFTATALDNLGYPIDGVEFSWTVEGLMPGQYSLDSWIGKCVNLTGYVQGVMWLNATATVGTTTKTGSSTVLFAGSYGVRSLDYEWSDMFNVPFGDWWNPRWQVYHSDEILSDTYPYIYRKYFYPEGHAVDYSSMRLNVTGRNLTEVNMNFRPEFLPLLGHERGGTANIDWYMQYLTTYELKTRYPQYASQDDGWIIMLNGTVVLDEQAAKAVLGVTDPGFDNFTAWWSVNQGSVADGYGRWLVDESERLNIYPAYEYYLQLFRVDLSASRVGNNVVLTYEIITWGMEALMMRWLHEAFMPAEFWYEDMNFHATIGPEMANIDIRTVVDYAVYADETIESIGNPDSTPCWTWEPRLADVVESSEAWPQSDIDPYLPHSYLTQSPVSTHHGTYIQYNYVPASWNLTDNETLRLKWPSGNQLFRYRTALGTCVDVSGEMIVEYSEPGPLDFPGQISVNSTSRTVEFKGPIDMWQWSRTQTAHSYLFDEWIRLGGDLLPYGLPMIEFRLKGPVPLRLGSFRIDVAGAVPAGDFVTFTVTALDNYGATYTQFTGTVNFTSTDSLAVLPLNYTFEPWEYGTHTFASALRFSAEGMQMLSVRNVSATPSVISHKNVTVLPKRSASAMQVDVYHLPAVGVPEDVTVTVFDQYGEVFVNYTGTVEFLTDRPGEASLPMDYVFQLSEAGVHTFMEELVFLGTGPFTVTARDKSSPTVSGSAIGIWVVPSPEVVDHFLVTGIKNMLTMQKSDVMVTAYNQYGMVLDRYTGTVHFSSNPPGGVFPSDYTFLESDHGFKRFTKTVSFTLPGTFTVTVSDLVVTSATGSQLGIVITYKPASQTFRMYDMFQQPWGEWWPWRYPAYRTDIILNNESGKYTLLYNPDGRGLQGIIYAPYRWNINGTNLSQMSVRDPEFMPVLGTPDVPGAAAKLDVYFQYLDRNWWNTYWKPVWNFPDTIMAAQTTDGWYLGVVYNVVMNRAAAEEWLGMPQAGTNPLTWWAVNGGKYLADWKAWISNEGNNRLDIWAGYEWPYIDLGTKMKLQILPDGKINLQIASLSNGYEILMTRWLSEADLCKHEAYYEDASMHVDYYSDWIDFRFDAVCQYSLHAVKANESVTNEPAWAWDPLLIDYVASWNTPGGTHPSKFDPWDPSQVLYQSWNAGDPQFGAYVPYDSGKAYFNLTSYQRFIIELPKGDDTLGYWAQQMPFDSIRRIIKGYTGTIPSPRYYDPYPRGDGSHYNNSAYWPLMMNGTMTLGWYGNWTGLPNLDRCYDPVSNVITMVGPMNFDNDHHYNGALYSGAPWIEFNVTPGLDLIPPIAVAHAYPNPANVTDVVTLDASSSSDPDGVIAVYEWTFIYDGVPVELQGQIALFRFNISGIYQITLKCTDNGGNSNSTSLMLTVGAPATFDLSLVQGWNFVSIPPVGYGYRASTLGLSAMCIVASWNSATQAYNKIFIVGRSPVFKDFAIEPSSGYWILATVPQTLHLQGSIPVGEQSKSIVLPPSGGWAMVGFNSLRTDMRASDIAANYTGGEVMLVVSYSPGIGYKVYDSMLPPTDYLLVPGKAYWIWATSSGTLTYIP